MIGLPDEDIRQKLEAVYGHVPVTLVTSEPPAVPIIIKVGSGFAVVTDQGKILPYAHGAEHENA